MLVQRAAPAPRESILIPAQGLEPRHPCIPKSMHPCAWGAHRHRQQLRDGAYCCVIPPESGEGCTDSPWQAPLAAKISPWVEELGGGAQWYPMESSRRVPYLCRGHPASLLPPWPRVPSPNPYPWRLLAAEEPPLLFKGERMRPRTLILEEAGFKLQNF